MDDIWSKEFSIVLKLDIYNQYKMSQSVKDILKDKKKVRYVAESAFK